MAMMMGRAMKRPALAVNPEVAQPTVNPMAAMAAAPQGMPGMKKGGQLKPVDASKNPGMSKLPTEVRNKMGYMNKGGMSKMHKMPDGKMMKDSDMKKMNMGGMSYKEGGMMDKSQDKAMIKKAFKQHDAQEHKGDKGTKLALKKGGISKGCGYASGGKTSQLSKANGIAVRGKTRGKIC